MNMPNQKEDESLKKEGGIDPDHPFFTGKLNTYRLSLNGREEKGKKTYIRKRRERRSIRDLGMKGKKGGALKRNYLEEKSMAFS